MTQLLTIAFRNLWQHRARNSRLALALSAVALLMVLLGALTEGVKQTLIRVSTGAATGHINVGGFYKITSGAAAPLITDYKPIFDLLQKEMPEISSMTVRMRGFGRLVSETSSQQSAFAGVDIDNEPRLKEVIRLKSGSFEGLRREDTILLFENQAEQLGVKVGDLLTISSQTARGATNTLDVTVTAIGADMGFLSTFNAFFSNAALRKLYQLADNSTGALHVYMRDFDSENETRLRAQASKMRGLLSAAGQDLMPEDTRPFFQKFEVVNRQDWTGQKVDVTLWQDELSWISWILDVLSGVRKGLSWLLLFIVSVGIINVLWVTIRERTREIGSLRAIGMQKTRVAAMFLLEGWALGVVSAVLGIFLAFLACFVLNALHLPLPRLARLLLLSDTLFFAPTLANAWETLKIFTVVIGIVSLIASMRAASLKPVTAMSHAG